ncbi:hypothetical protein GOV05_04960 [Candidatus Woesearchaeota archaeon]|nr:hypothetical protein [Candidatus Woesearchaeota archaeon]
MEIRIDTEKDSQEHIREVIKLLRNIIGDTSSLEVAESNTPTPSNFSDMFSDETSNDSPPSNDMFSDPDITVGDLNQEEVNEEEKEDSEDLKIIPY